MKEASKYSDDKYAESDDANEDFENSKTASQKGEDKNENLQTCRILQIPNHKGARKSLSYVLMKIYMD